MNRPARNSTGGVDSLIGSRMRELRKHANLTQEQLAVKLEWDKRVISDIERGQRNITLTELADICSVAEMPLDRLLDPIGVPVDSDTARRALALRAGVPTVSETWEAPPVTDDEVRQLEARRSRRLEDLMLGKLPGMERFELLDIADDLFHQGAYAERERLVEKRLSEDDTTSAFGIELEPSVVRGHVTRDIIRQIREHAALTSETNTDVDW